MTDPARIPPQDPDAERMLLSAAMVETRLDELSHLIRAEHFYADAHQHIWRAVEELAGQGKPYDLPAVAGLLRDRDRLASVGGTPYLGSIVEAPYSVKLEPVAMRVLDKWRLRQLIRESQAITAEAYATPRDVGAFVQAAEGRMYRAAGDAPGQLRAQTAREIMAACVPEIARRHRKEAPVGHSTGFRSLDLRIGGLRRGRMYVVAARPGMGKTALLTQMLCAVGTSGKPDRGVFLASLEMPNDQIGERLLAQQAAIDTRKVELGWVGKGEWDTLLDASRRIADLPLIVDDIAGMTVSLLRSSIRRAKRRFEQEFGVDLGLVAIDYFQLLSSADIPWSGNTNDVLEQQSKALAQMAKEFDVPVVLLSQLNRECEKRPGKRPQLSDLRGSGALEQDGHTVMFIFREDLYRQDRKEHDRSAEIIICKARGGRVGTVHLSYVDWCTKFGDDRANDDDPMMQYQREADALGDFAGELPDDPRAGDDLWAGTPVGDADEQDRRHP